MRTRNPLPLFEELHRILHYDPVSGELRRTERTSGRVKVGAIAGCRGARCFYVCVGGKLFRGHRIIWKMMTGIDPEFQIDHRDGNPFNNAWDNLRASTQAQNMANKAVRSDSRTGLKGITCIRGRKYVARICKDGVIVRLGLFDTAAQAHAAYVKAATETFGEFACDGRRGANISVLDGLPP